MSVAQTICAMRFAFAYVLLAATFQPTVVIPTISIGTWENLWLISSQSRANTSSAPGSQSISTGIFFVSDVMFLFLEEGKGYLFSKNIVGHVGFSHSDVTIIVPWLS